MKFYKELITYLLMTRFVEFLYSRSLEKKAKAQGAVEYGKTHYPIMVLLHSAFPYSIYLEARKKNRLNRNLILPFIVLELLRLIVILYLGDQWNSKILVNPKKEKNRTGIYKYMNHPNYRIIEAEMFMLPLVVGSPMTSLLFGTLNLLFLEKIRIPAENEALKNYR